MNKLGDAIATGVWITFMHPMRILLASLVILAIWSDFGANYYYGKWLGFGAAFLTILGMEIG